MIFNHFTKNFKLQIKKNESNIHPFLLKQNILTK